MRRIFKLHLHFIKFIVKNTLKTWKSWMKFISISNLRILILTINNRLSTKHILQNQSLILRIDSGKYHTLGENAPFGRKSRKNHLWRKCPFSGENPEITSILGKNSRFRARIPKIPHFGWKCPFWAKIPHSGQNAPFWAKIPKIPHFRENAPFCAKNFENIEI